MTTHLQRIGSRVPQNYTIDQAMHAAFASEPSKFARAIFNVLTESQQIRVLEQVGWVVCPGPAIDAAPE